MTFVLDASAWVEVLTTGVHVEGLADRWVVVPPHFDVEVLGAVRAMQQHGDLTPALADECARRHRRRTVDRVYNVVDMTRAWELREALSFRDAWYVALAERLDAPWLTADRKAARTAKRLGVAVEVV